ncbi:hypothetical protein, partial [Shewanella surugensis]
MAGCIYITRSQYREKKEEHKGILRWGGDQGGSILCRIINQRKLLPCNHRPNSPFLAYFADLAHR